MDLRRHWSDLRGFTEMLSDGLYIFSLRSWRDERWFEGAERRGKPCAWCGEVHEASAATMTKSPGVGSVAYPVKGAADWQDGVLEALSWGDERRDDASITLLDGWAVVADVLGFYQERVANEGYLRTATERRSVHELGGLAGDELGEGVAPRVEPALTYDSLQMPSSEIPASSPMPTFSRVRLEKAAIRFGDGRGGVRLPEGIENVRAVYRVRLGVSGEALGGRLSRLTSRPLGIRAVTNPLRAAGGSDPEEPDEARHSAPATVLTFDRAVSAKDYDELAKISLEVGRAHPPVEEPEASAEAPPRWRFSLQPVKLGRCRAGTEVLAAVQCLLAVESLRCTCPARAD